MHREASGLEKLALSQIDSCAWWMLNIASVVLSPLMRIHVVEYTIADIYG